VKKQCPEVKSIAQRFGNPDRPEGQREGEDLITAFPNLNGLFTVGDQMAIGASDAIKAAGKAGQVRITTAGFFEESLPFIQSGAIDIAVDESAVLVGRLAVVRAVQVLNGTVPPRITILPTPVRTRENIKGLDTSAIWAPSKWRLQ